MARTRRLKVKGKEGYYHIISRTVGQEFYFGDVEKENLFEIIKHYSRLYFIKVIGICILSNHFHLLIKSEPESFYSDAEVIERAKKYIYKENKDKEINSHELLRIRSKLEDISEYVRSIKQTFSRWYNKANNRTGYLWGDRFKSVLIEKGESLLNCLAYIDLNPIRAGIVNKPEDYRWSGIGYRFYAKNRGRFLSFDGVFSEFELKKTDKEKLNQYYRAFVYKCGNIKRITFKDIEEGKGMDEMKNPIGDEIYNKEMMRDFKLPKSIIMINRIRFFSDGLVIGSRGFLKEAYSKFGGEIILKKDRNVYKTGISTNILSLRKLIC